MFRRTDDCEFEGSSHSIGIQHGTPVTSGGASGRGKRKASAITVGQLASTRWEVRDECMVYGVGFTQLMLLETPEYEMFAIYYNA